MPPLPLSAATGGLSAAIVSNLLHDRPLPPFACQELDPHSGLLLWCIFAAGILVGIFAAQLLDFLVLGRHYLGLALRQRSWVFSNSLAIKNRSV